MLVVVVAAVALLLLQRRATAAEESGGADSLGEALAGGSSDWSDTEEGTFAGGSSMNVNLTTYYPFGVLSHAARLMEGGIHDRKSNDLHSLEMHLADPAAHPFVSLSGDPTIFRYGQRLDIPALGAGVVARVVDTGSHFTGPGKVYRHPGYEPIDVCVDSAGGRPFSGQQSATIVDGDVWTVAQVREYNR